jgi:PST family polysaccharide transporter
MLKYIKHKFSGTEERKRLTGNIISLGVLQVANYILPLLTLPYLVRVLGPEYFGLLAFATSTNMYFILITDYGFNLSATRHISIDRNDIDKVNEIFSAVMIIKTVLMVVSLVLMSILVLGFEVYRQYWEVYFLTFGTVIGNLLFPIWLFQGMEQMKYISYLNIGTKVFFTLCIFLFVRKQEDYFLVPLFTSLGFIVSGLLSIYLAKKHLKIHFFWQKWDVIKFYFSEGLHLFSSIIATSFYTTSTTIILGLFTDNATVGIFSVSDKIVQAVKSIYQPFSQSIYPLIGKKIHENEQRGMQLIKRITIAFGIPMFIISTLLFFFADKVVLILFGDQYDSSVNLLEIMAFLPFLITLSNIFGVQTMLNLGYKGAFGRIIIFASIIGLISSLIFVPKYQEVGSAWIVLIVELLVTTCMWLFLKKRIWKLK